MKKVSRFELKDLLPISILFIVLGIAMAFGLNIIGDTKTDFCTGESGSSIDATGAGCWRCGDTGAPTFNATTKMCGNATVFNFVDATAAGDASFNASVAASEGIAKIPAKMPLLATVILAAVIIGILMTYMVKNRY